METARVVEDAASTSMVDGDTLALIKDLKPGSGSQVLKRGTKPKDVRLVASDQEVSRKIDGVSLTLKAFFVKKPDLRRLS